MAKMKTLTVNGESYTVEDADSVSFGESQELTTEQQERARENIGAATIDNTKVGADAWSSKNTVDKLCPTFTERGTVVTCEPVEGYPLEVVSKIVPKQDGTGDPSPDNVRPISGHSAVKVTHTGKNIFGGDVMESKLVELGGKKDASDNSVNITGANLSGEIVFSNFKENTQYTFVLDAKTKTTSSSLSVQIVYADGTQKVFYRANSTEREVYVYVSEPGKTVTKLSGIYYSDTTFYCDTCGIFEGAVSIEDFEAYRGETFTLDLGQTVYGGSLDWNSGVLTVGWGETILDEKCNWRLSIGTGKIQAMCKNTVAIPASAAYCDKFPWGGSSSGLTNRFYIGGDFNVYTDYFSTSEEWNAFVKANPLHVVYQLAEPFTIQLTAQEILALSGVNTLYSDTGDTEVTGKANPSAIIEKLTNAIIALGGNV